MSFRIVEGEAGEAWAVADVFQRIADLCSSRILTCDLRDQPISKHVYRQPFSTSCEDVSEAISSVKLVSSRFDRLTDVLYSIMQQKFGVAKQSSQLL